MGDTIVTVSGLLFIAFSTILLKLWGSRSVKLPYPPGPKPNFLAGNFLIIPTTRPWFAYTSWAKIYGDVYHFKAFHQHIVVINNVKDAIALFEKRSQIYSDRPIVTMLYMMGWGFNAGVMPYGDEWRRHRRIYQQNFKKEASINYRPTQTRKIHEMLHKLLTTPEDFEAHCRNGCVDRNGDLYDNNISSTDIDRFADVAEQAVTRGSEILFPGAILVNIFPFLRHLPSWFPGAGFKRFAEECKVYTDQMQDIPFNFVQEKMAAGVETSGLTADLLRRKSARGDDTADAEKDIKGVTATAFAAGSDTTVSALETFFYAMLVNPDAQQKGHEEIDRVIGPHRLPDYDDRARLPYVEAIFREVMRWRPVLPLGFFHNSSKDDVYNGYYIPKGTMLVSNIWAMAHDESKYPQPDSFLPEHFLDKSGVLNDDDEILAFGFGRRICPGRHMANATVWLTIVTVLATFNIAKAKDADGNEIPVDDVYSDSATSHKLPYRNSVTPRSKEAIKLILEAHVENSDLTDASPPHVLSS